jgi:protein TonB
MAAFAAGLLLEAAALAILLPVMTHRSPPAQTQSIIRLSVLAPAPLAPPTPKPVPVAPPKPVAPPPLPPPPPLPLAPPLPPALPAPVAPNRPVIHHPQHLRHFRPQPVQPPVAQAPTPLVPPAPAPPPAPKAVAQPSAGEVNLFQAQMNQAVQRAAIADYPQAAQMAQENGKVGIRFVFEDGAVRDAVILQSSGYPLLDAAALQAVRDAHYPPQPPDFAGEPHRITALVVFHTSPPDVSGD